MILIIGAGVAGLSAARAAHDAGAAVTLVTAGSLAAQDACNTAMAQGGIAAAIAPNDAAAAHLADTVSAGSGLVDNEAARVLVAEGTRDVRALIASGFAADRGPAGDVSLGLEGAHGQPRIVHAGGDRTGAVLQAHLVAQLPLAVRVIEHATLGSLLIEAGALSGAEIVHATGLPETVNAREVILATGGYSALYDRTSNHAGARGAGIIAAANAGALVADLEFVQFHPTVLAGTGQLISEAVRGAGAVLLDRGGQQFMVGRHPAADLASRDIVSREIHRVMLDTSEDSVLLDATRIERAQGAGTLARLFPAIDAAMRELGYDWGVEPVPVAPAAHYTMGGVATDLDGRTTVPGLYAAGEVASTGVHGANRLASNSLLEGLVFGRRAGAAAAARNNAGSTEWDFVGDALSQLMRQARTAVSVEPAAPGQRESAATAHKGPGLSVGQLLSTYLGIERDAIGISLAIADLTSISGSDARLATLIAQAALAREESRGGHQRADFAGTDADRARRQAFLLHRPAAHTDSDSALAPMFNAAHTVQRNPVAC